VADLPHRGPDEDDPDMVGVGDSQAGSAALSARQPLVPPWLSNLAELGWRILVIAALAVIIWLTVSAFWVAAASIALAVVVGAAFEPLTLRLLGQGRSRTGAAAITWAIAILGILAVLVLLVLAFVPSAIELASRLETGLSDLRARLVALELPPAVVELAGDALRVVTSEAGGAVGGLVASAGAFVTVLILATFLVFFVLRDSENGWAWLEQAIPDHKRHRITADRRAAIAGVGGYLRRTTVVSALIAVTDLLFMLLLGVPLAGPIAVLVFLGGYIPYLGRVVTAAVMVLVALAAVGPVPALVLLTLIVARDLIVRFVILPAGRRTTVRLHPALALLVLLAGFELLGILGLFVAVPVTAVLLAVTSAMLDLVEPDTHPALPGLVPAWLDRLAQWSWRILVAVALLALLVAVLSTIPLVVIPLVIALVLAASLDPVVQWLTTRGRSRTEAAGIAVGGGFVLVVVVLALSLAAVVDHAGEVGNTATAGSQSVSDALGGHLELGVGAVAGGAAEGVRAVAAVAEGAATVVVITVVGVLLAFFFLRDGAKWWDRWMARMRPGIASELDAAGTRAFDVFGGYMIGTAAISFVGAASQLVIMVVLGIPLALPVFVLSFLLCFIPYIGGFISTGIAFLLTVAAGSAADVVIMAIWTIVFNIVQGNVVSPLVYGRTVHLHPAIVLVAIPAASAVAGVLGMFIVVPVLGVVATTWRTVLAVMAARRAPADARLAADPSTGVTEPSTA
jgi:predicted PurR-regulated permease PerM